MKILILTSSNPYKTAGIVAYDLCNALNKLEGTEAIILTKAWYNYKKKSIRTVHTAFREYFQRLLNQPKKIFFRLLKKDKRSNLKNESSFDPNYSVQGIDQTKTYYSSKLLLKRAGITPDAIIVLFMPYFLSFKNLYELNQMTKAPIFLYMMDMAPMTGGCHYAWNCDGYKNECGSCPAFFSKVEEDQSRLNWNYKREYIDMTNLAVIAGSEYQFLQLKKSSLYKGKIKDKILISLDPNVFKPGNKRLVRDELKLPTNKKIIFFGAGNINSRRKGFKELFAVLNELYRNIDKQSQIHLAIAGNGFNESEFKIPFETTLLGQLDHNNLPKAFQAADLFICPSIEDSGPMMINQSLMSGTPIVSFEMGIALDLVMTNLTGYKAKLGDISDMASGIQHMLQLDDYQYDRISQRCRNLALKLCSPLNQAESFRKLIEVI